MWGISNESPEVLRRFVDIMGITFPILRDEDGAIANTYNQLGAVPASPYPRDWVVGSDGRIIYRNNGFDVGAMRAVLEEDLDATP